MGKAFQRFRARSCRRGRISGRGSTLASLSSYTGLVSIRSRRLRELRGARGDTL